MSGDMPPGWYPDPSGLGARRWDGSAWELPFPEFQPEPGPDPGRSGGRRWLVPAGIGLAVVVVAAGSTLLTLRAADKPVSAPVTVTSVAPPPPVPVPVKSPTEIAEFDVKASMQKKLDSFPDLKSWKLLVVDVVLVNKAGNEFKGIAHIKAKDGPHDVAVDVTSDGSNTLWEAPPGWLDFTAPTPEAETIESPPPPPRPQLTALDFEFLRKAHADGFTGSADDLIASAVSVCLDLRHGKDLPEISQELSGRNDLTPDQAHLFASEVFMTYPTCHS